MKAKIKIKRGTTAQWALNDPILADGEPGWDTDLRVMKIGNGVLPWSELIDAEALSDSAEVSAESAAASSEAAAASAQSAAASATLADGVAAERITELDADPTSDFRVQQDARLSLVIKPSAHGAVGDGTTNDAVALADTLLAAAAAAAYGRVRVDLDGKQYMTGTRLQMPSDVELSNGTIFSSVGTASGGIIQFQANASGWVLRNLTIDVGKANTGLLAGTALLNNCVYMSGTQHDGLIEGCTFIGSKSQSIDMLTGVYDITIRNNKFSDIKGAIRVYQGARGIRVEENDFTRWHGIAVHLDGDAIAGPSGIRIVDNTFHDPSPYATTAGGFVARQSIVAIGDITNPIRDLTITGNVIEGPGMPFSAATTTNSDLATGDQITLWYCDEFIVDNNKSFGGGENGVSIVRGVRNGIVSNNVIARADGHGLQVGRIGNTAYNITVIGNTVFNCGLDENNEQDDLAGIFMQDTVDCTVIGNTFYDDQAVPTQDYGILFNDAVGTVFLGNQGHGNVKGNVSSAGGTTTFRQYWESNTLQVGSSTTAVQPRIAINAPVGQRRELRYTTAGTDRWRLYASSNAEGGTKAVTNKALTSNVATITTSTAHGLTVGATAYVRNVDQKAAPVEDVFDGDWVVTSVPTTTTFTFDRIKPDVPSQADTGVVYNGTNTGSNLVLERYADQGGTALGQVFSIDRATGKVTFTPEVQFNGAVTGIPAVTAPVVATKGSNQVLPQSSTALTAVTNLTAAVAANATTEVRFFLYCDGDTTADMRVKPVIPAGATVDWWVNAGSTGLAVGGTGSGNFNYGDESTTHLAVGVAAPGVKTVAVVTCRVITAGTAGNVTLEAAQNAPTAADVTIYARSQVVTRREV